MTSSAEQEEINEPIEKATVCKKIKHVNPYKKKRFEKRFAQILLDSINNPLNISFNGAYFIDNENFAVNPKILSHRLSIKANSLLKDFRCLDIVYIKKKFRFHNVYLPQPKNWKIYQHKRKEFTLNQIIENLNSENKTNALCWNGSKYISKKKLQTPDIENEINSKQDQNLQNEHNNANTNEIPQPRLKYIDIKIDGELINKIEEESDGFAGTEDYSYFYF